MAKLQKTAEAATALSQKKKKKKSKSKKQTTEGKKRFFADTAHKTSYDNNVALAPDNTVGTLFSCILCI